MKRLQVNELIHVMGIKMKYLNCNEYIYLSDTEVIKKAREEQEAAEASGIEIERQETLKDKIKWVEERKFHYLHLLALMLSTMRGIWTF